MKIEYELPSVFYHSSSKNETLLSLKKQGFPLKLPYDKKIEGKFKLSLDFICIFN